MSFGGPIRNQNAGWFTQPGSGSGISSPRRALSNRDAFNLVEGRSDRSNDPRCACGAYLSKYGSPNECAPCERTKRIERAS